MKWDMPVPLPLHYLLFFSYLLFLTKINPLPSDQTLDEAWYFWFL